MQLQFQKTIIPCLKPVLHQVETLEQTQELRIPENMPVAARMISAWGQVILRSKQWQGSTLELTGGVQAWVAYEPEKGGQLQCLDTWIPIRMRWDLPDGIPEGRVRVLPRLRSVDARMVSAGKIMLRVGIAALAEGWSAMEGEVCRAEGCPEDVELLQTLWPVRLPRETGEKAFQLEEDLTLPSAAPKPEKLLYWHLEPTVTDKKVLADKLVFRGNGNLHIFYLCADGQLCSWDFELPFSQHAQLEQGYSSAAQADVVMALTRLELEMDEAGMLHFHGGMTGQYLVDDQETLQIPEDAWSPYRDLTVQREPLTLPVVLDQRREMVCAEQQLGIDADLVADALFLPDFPQVFREADRVSLEQSGMVQLTWWDAQGQLQSSGHRWKGTTSLQADASAEVSVRPMEAQLRVVPGSGSVTVGVEIPVQVVTGAGQDLSMVTGMELGERRMPDPNRPSLVLRRAGKDRLWDIARENGSTVDAIRAANGLETDPEPDRMLLIPVV